MLGFQGGRDEEIGFEIRSEIVDPDSKYDPILHLNIVCPWMDDMESPPDILRVVFTVGIKAESAEEAKENVRRLINGEFKNNWAGTELKGRRRVNRSKKQGV